MITTCTGCGKGYEVGSEEQANEQERFCPKCCLDKAHESHLMALTTMATAINVTLYIDGKEEIVGEAIAWPSICLELNRIIDYMLRHRVGSDRTCKLLKGDEIHKVSLKIEPMK